MKISSRYEGIDFYDNLIKKGSTGKLGKLNLTWLRSSSYHPDAKQAPLNPGVVIFAIQSSSTCLDQQIRSYPPTLKEKQK